MDPRAERPLERWEGRSAMELAGRWGAPGVRPYASVGSTNDVARRLAETGCPAGTVVLAEEQTAGRGRGHRRWVSPAGLGVYLSLVLRPGAPADTGALPLIVGLAAARALDPFCRPIAPRIKWPNDLLADGRKLGGILCEGAWDRDRIGHVVVGIGLNVLHSVDDFPQELRGSATSVRCAGGWNPEREEVAGAVVREVLAAVERPFLDAQRLAELESRDCLRGHDVVVSEGALEVVRGRALGIGREGNLLVRTDAGVLRSVRSGTVRQLPVPAPEPA